MDTLPTLLTQPLLTIAIPTYNRSKYLSLLLEGIFDQILHEDRVELIVSDNASTDETAKVVDELKLLGLKLQYLKNECNLGADRNILQCYEKAQGKYVWIFGDDDLILPGGISTILKYISAGEYDLLYVSSCGFQNNNYPVAAISRGTIEITNVEEYVRRVHVFLTFISGNIVNKNRVSKARPAKFSSLIGTSLVQLSWIYTAIEIHQRSLFIRDVIVATRTNNTGGYDLFVVFGPRFKAITEAWLNSERLRRLILNGTLQYFFPGFLLASKLKDHVFSRKDPDKVLRETFHSNYRYWFFDMPIAILPRGCDRAWVALVRAVNWLDMKCGSPIMR